MGRLGDRTMTDDKTLLKQQAKAIHAAIPNLDISRSQAIELTVALLTDADSWNHFAARPTGYLSPTHPTIFLPL